MLHVDAEQPTAMDVDADGDLTNVGILENHANKDTVGPDPTVIVAAVSDESHLV